MTGAERQWRELLAMMRFVEDMTLAGGLIFDQARRRGWHTSGPACDATAGMDLTSAGTMRTMCQEAVR